MLRRLAAEDTLIPALGQLHVMTSFLDDFAASRTRRCLWGAGDSGSRLMPNVRLPVLLVFPQSNLGKDERWDHLARHNPTALVWAVQRHTHHTWPIPR